MQRYRVRLGTVADAAVRTEESLVPRLKAMNGFVAYHLLHTGQSEVAVLALFESRPAADAGARFFNEWFRSDWPAFRLLAPDLSVAESLTLEQANGAGEAGQVATTGDPLLDRVLETEPVARDRRRIGERRLLVVARVPERRSGVDRRTSLERRAGSERRGEAAPTATAELPERRRIAPAWRRREAFRSR